jgi:hypothetical protein
VSHSHSRTYTVSERGLNSSSPLSLLATAYENTPQSCEESMRAHSSRVTWWICLFISFCGFLSQIGGEKAAKLTIFRPFLLKKRPFPTQNRLKTPIFRSELSQNTRFHHQIGCLTSPYLQLRHRIPPGHSIAPDTTRQPKPAGGARIRAQALGGGAGAPVQGVNEACLGGEMSAKTAENDENGCEMSENGWELVRK